MRVAAGEVGALAPSPESVHQPYCSDDCRAHSWSASQLLEGQVSEDMLEAVVPVELPVLDGYLLGARHHQPGDLCKLAKKLGSWSATYLFPVLILLGFTSALLKCANHFSIGDAS